MDLAPVHDIILYYRRLLEKGVTFIPTHQVKEIKGIRLSFTMSMLPSRKEPWKTSICLSWPWARIPGRPLQRIEGRVPELYRIGDCVAPRRAQYAVWDGHMVGRKI